MTTQPVQKLLVSGASGQLGRRVVELLLEAGHGGHLVATTRTPEKLKDLAARGVEVRKADFDDAASLVAAFQGVQRLLLVSTDALDRPGRRIAQHRAAVKAAQEAGVKHVVYTSLPNPGPDSPVLLAPDHHATEQALKESGLGYTILRNNLYLDLQLHTLPRAVATGKLVTATGTGSAAYVTREDCARAAAAALASDREGRFTLDVTGPAAVSQEELARIVSDVTGRPVTHVSVETSQLRDGMVGAGLPAPIADVYASFDTAIAQGKLASVSSTVQDLTGRAPMSVASFLARHKAELLGARG